MDPKLMLLFLLIGTIIGLSHLGRDGEGVVRRLLVRRPWRRILRRG
jgi:hypothetical protein